MSAVSILNPKADTFRKYTAFLANYRATQGLMECVRTNLGPNGTLKMLVGGAGQIKITKDGNVLLQEVQISNPTASMIARVATAQDSITGDGTTSTVLLVSELMRECEKYITQNIVHPHILCNGIDEAKKATLEFLDKFKHPLSTPISREILQSVARTSLETKLQKPLAHQLTDILVDAIQCIHTLGTPIDLFMIEILGSKQNLCTDSRFIKGMVMDHGARHPDMPKRLKNCYILTCNVSLEYEKTEVNSGFFYSTAEQRSKLVDSERKFTDEKVMKIIQLKRQVCQPGDNTNFVVFNQKGIDPPSLDLLAREGIPALRRVKRRNMERLTLCCGGNAMNSVDDLKPEDLGFAGEVYEESIEDEKWTFVEDVKHPKSCAILIKGPNEYSISQIKDAVRDGLRAIKNTIDDEALVPGAGALEMAAYNHLQNLIRDGNVGKLKYGISAFAEALLSIPRVLCENSGLDFEDCFLEVTQALKKGEHVGIDLTTSKPCIPSIQGIWDNYCVKKQLINLAPTLTQQLLLVDEIIKAGKQMSSQKE